MRPRVAYFARAGPCVASLTTTRWNTGEPFVFESGSVKSTAVADGETIASPAALYEGIELRASPEHDVPITPTTFAFAATPGATFAATVPSHCESALMSLILTFGFVALYFAIAN